MNGDITLLIILSVGTLILNKDHIFSEWFSTTNPSDVVGGYPEQEEQ